MSNEYGTALVSDCGCYRYRLIRKWRDGPILVWVMLNPSTADADKDDATIRRVRGFTKREGYDGFVVVNVWALRATDPKDLHQRRATSEPENIAHVKRAVRGRDVVVAWGVNVRGGPAWGALALADIYLALQSAADVRCLGLTKGGEPRHPLRLRRDTPLVPWKGNKR